jgi:hypothetical protein
MNIVINDEKIASKALINDYIKKQLESMNYKIVNYDEVVDKDPIRVKNIKGGFLFLQTYHKWYWKIIYKIKLHESEGKGHFKLYIELPHNIDTLNIVKIFIKGLEERLDELKESLEINFIYVPDFEEGRTDDIPETDCY